MEDLQLVEHVVREDEGVIEQCVISGIPREDMHKVYCDRKCCDFSRSLALALSFFSSASSTKLVISAPTIVVFFIASLKSLFLKLADPSR